MPSSYTLSCRFTLQATGENNNTWGTILNTGVFALVDYAIAGRLAFNLSGALTLTTALGAADQARAAMLDITGGTGGQITIPAVSKGYFVRNAATGNVQLTAGGATMAILKPGDIQPVFSDGSNVYPLRIAGLSLQDYIAAQVTGGGNLPAPVGNLNKALIVRDFGGGPTWLPSNVDFTEVTGQITNPQIGLGVIFTGNIAGGQITAPLLAPGVVVSNLGYTPVNKAGDTINGSLGVTGNIVISGQLYFGASGRAGIFSDNASFFEIVWDIPGGVQHFYNWSTGVLNFMVGGVTKHSLDQNGNAFFAGNLTAGNITPSDGSVTTAKLANLAVTNAKLGLGAVFTGNVGDGQITAVKLGAGAAVGNIGYTPVNRAGDSITGNLTVNGTLNALTNVLVGNPGRFGFSTDNATYAQIVLDTTLNYYLRLDWTTGKLTYYANNIAVFSIDSAGNVKAKGTITPSTVP